MPSDLLKGALWVPTGAGVPELVACWTRARRRQRWRTVLPGRLVAELGIHRNTARYVLADPVDPGPFEKRAWRPILAELLPLPLSVPAKILATHLARRQDREDGNGYVPTLRDWAEDLGWSARRVWRAYRALRRASLLTEQIANKRGACTTLRRSFASPSAQKRYPPAHRSGTRGAQKRYPPAPKPGTRQRTDAVPALCTGTGTPLPSHRPGQVTAPRISPRPFRFVPAFEWHRDGGEGILWGSIGSRANREQLDLGVDPGSILAVLGALHVDIGADRLAVELAGAGVSTADVLGVADVVYKRPGVRSRSGLLHVELRRLLDRPAAPG